MDAVCPRHSCAVLYGQTPVPAAGPRMERQFLDIGKIVTAVPGGISTHGVRRHVVQGTGACGYESCYVEDCAESGCACASTIEKSDTRVCHVVAGTENKEYESELAHGDCFPQREDEWELIEAARTHTVRRIDDGIWQEWELALPAACVATERSCIGLVPFCMIPLASMPHDTLHEQGSALSIGGEPQLQTWRDLWNVRMPEKEDEQQENWSVATTCSDEAEEGPFTCEHCPATLPTRQAFDDHLRGFKHRKKMRKQEKLLGTMGRTKELDAASAQTIAREEE